MAKRDGHLTPQQMYEAVKRYKTYVARNKRLDGKGTNTSAGQQKATSQSSGYKPRFHKTTAFVATAGELDDEADHPPGSSPYEDSDPMRLNLLPRKTRVCTSPVTSRRLYGTILFCRSRWPAPCEFRR